MRIYRTFTEAMRYKTSNDVVMKVDNGYMVLSIHHYCICKMDGVTPRVDYNVLYDAFVSGNTHANMYSLRG